MILEPLPHPTEAPSPWTLFDAELRRWGPQWSDALAFLRDLPPGTEVTLRAVKRLVPRDADGFLQGTVFLAAAADRSVLERVGRRPFPFRDGRNGRGRARVRYFRLCVFRRVV